MIFSYLLNMQSHPSWVCGLKQHWYTKGRGVAWSHPSWVCGLKHGGAGHEPHDHHVTPFVGVWIETILSLRESSGMQRHTLRGCVD